MNIHLTLDKAGRIVLPKPLRDELALSPGDSLALENAGDRIILRPLRNAAPLRKERGIWVYRTGKPLDAATTATVLRQGREEREHRTIAGDR